MTAGDFPLAGVARSPGGGLVRADQRTLAERTCGCGERAVTTLVIQRVRGRGGARTNTTSRVPLCRRHDEASRAQGRRRRAAQARAWAEADAAIRQARAARRALLARPLLTFTVITESRPS